MTENEKKSLISKILKNNDGSDIIFFELLLINNPDSILMLFSDEQTVFKDRFASITHGSYESTQLAPYDKLLIYTKEIIADIKNKRQTLTPLKIASCINFDSNIISYLNNFYENNNLPDKENFLLLMEEISKKETQTSASPYLLEASFTTKVEDKTKVYKNLLHFFSFTLDGMPNNKIGNLINNEAYIMADRAFTEFSLNNELPGRIYILSCLIAKSFLIKINNKIPSKRKKYELLDYLDNTLLCYLEFEFPLMIGFMQNDSNLTYFFRKLQVNVKHIDSVITNMAWDLFHIRNIISEMEARAFADTQDIIFIHSLVTYDKGLQSLLKYNPIKKLLYCSGSIYPSFEKDLSSYFSDEDSAFMKFNSNRDTRELKLNSASESYMKELWENLKCELKTNS